jgi:hypothetical protein
MSLRTITAALRGEVPGTSDAQLKVYTNEALGLIYDDQLWSFQLQTGGWFTPGLLGGGSGASPTLGISPGTITVNTYDDTITGDATASAAWLALVGRPLLTEFQIRVPYYSLYSIISVNDDDPTAVVLTIDRPWMEPSQAGGQYMMYQAYFPCPAPDGDFKRFFAIRDTTNAIDIDFWSLRQTDLALRDPQRTVFNLPCYAVPYQIDQRPNSQTIGSMLYELWPNPLSALPYTINFMRRGPLLARNSDEVPYPITDELVKWRAIEVASLWKQRQIGDEMARGSGADWKFAAQAARENFVQLRKTIAMKDRQQIDLYMSRLKPTFSTNPFATINSQLNVGRW